MGFYGGANWISSLIVLSGTISQQTASALAPNLAAFSVRNQNGVWRLPCTQGMSPTAWFHMNAICDSNCTGAVSFYEGTQEVLRVTCREDNNSLDAGIYVWDGATMTKQGATISDYWPGASTPFAYDIEFNLHASTGYVRLYRGGNLIAERTGLDTNDGGNITEITHMELSTTNQWFQTAQHIMGDESTLNCLGASLAPSAAGTNSDWTGAYTDIDEFTPNDADYINSGTPGAISTFGLSDINAAYSAMDVGAVIVNTRGRATGGADAYAALRTGGTDYLSSALSLPAAFTPTPAAFQTNPDTAAAWTVTELNALEAGVEVV